MSNANLHGTITGDPTPFERAAGRAAKANDNFMQSVLRGNKSVGQALRVAGASFATISAGISAARASSESFEKSLLSVGTAVIAGFGAGGPIGAGVALLGAGIGALIGTSGQAEKAAARAAEEARKADEVHQKWLIDAAKRAEDYAARLEEVNLKIQALRGDGGAERALASGADRSAVGSAQRELQVLLDRLASAPRPGLGLQSDALGKHMPGWLEDFTKSKDLVLQDPGAEDRARLMEQIAAKEREIGALVQIRVRNEDERDQRKKVALDDELRAHRERRALIKAEGDAHRAALEESFRRQAEIARLVKLGASPSRAANEVDATLRLEREERIRQAQAAQAKAGGERAKALDEQLRRQERIQALAEADRRFASEILLIEDLRKDGLTALADRVQVLLDGKRAELEVEAELAAREKLRREDEQKQEAAERTQQARDRDLQTMRREIQMLDTASEFDRRRLQIAHELSDTLKEVANDEERIAAAKELAGRKLAQIAKDEAHAAAQAAAAEKERAKAAQEAAAAKRRESDITKRFDRLPGSGGLFGFGAGRVGLAFSEGGASRRRRGPGKAAPKAPADAPAVPDPVPAIEQATAAIGGVKDIYGRLAAAAAEQAAVAGQVFKASSTATVSAVGALKRSQDDMRRDLAAMQQRLAKLSGAGVAGG